MKRTSTQNKCLATGLMLIAMLLMSLGVKAQNVTIDLLHGSLLGAVTDEGETGFAQGYRSLWRHEQLALSMTGTDRDGLTATGEISEPSAVFGQRDGKITIVGGRRPSFIVVSLPKGYRITGYTLVLANDLVGNNSNVGTGNFASINDNDEPLNQGQAATMRFYETKPWPDNETNAGHASRDGCDNHGYNANQVRYIELGTDWQNGQIGQTQSDILATAEAADGDKDINPSDVNKKYTISRTSQSEDDMGNQIYFRLVKNYCFYGLTIESFEIRFTAEGTFEADVVPSSVGKATSVVRAPFKTNKIDIGEMTNNTQPGTSNTAFSYSWENITDLDAYNYLYQEDAVADGVPADVAENKHIYPVKVDNQLLYALGNDTYYIETPVEIVNHGNHAPIGYRIVGARFNYLYGSYTPGETHETFTHHYITYESGGTTYYLNESGRFIANEASAAEWNVDDNGNVYCGTNTYLGCSGNGNDRTLTAAANAGNRLSLDTGGRLYYHRNNNNTNLYLHGTTSATTAPRLINNTNDLAYRTEKVEEGYTVPAFNPGPYKLKIWNREGTAVKETIEVNSSDDVGVYDLGLCNNDAIKFQITDLADGHQALVSVTLFLQALNPYIDKMDIVCQDARKVLSLTQTFTADNFSVAGDRFIFYVPADYGNEWLDFTFSGLYSKYGDETYYDRTGHGAARYSFVRSPYFITVDEVGDDGLYDNTVYDPDHTYVDKVYTVDAGKYRFKFNNAEDLAQAGSGTSGFLEEYPFSVPIYLATKNPGDKTATPKVDPSDDTGEFIKCKLHAQSQKTGTYYVFTADETRWNIAPTFNWQHRYYAFYRMEIELVAKTFTPDFKWKKIYDKTCFASKDANDNEINAMDSMWGLALDVSDTDNAGQKVQGYLTYQEIIDNIKGREETLWTADDTNLPSQDKIGTVKWSKIDSKLDPNNTTAPKSIEQILYIDGTPLYAMINSSQYSEVKTLEDLKYELNKNSLVFLPENTTSTLDNVAYKTSSGTFQAGKNIVLKDKLPFFSPYNIQVDAANYATYSREISGPGNILAQYATVVLPFTLSVTEGEGLHTNRTDKGEPTSDGFSFTLRQMAQLQNPNDYTYTNNNYYSEGNFVKIQGKSTEANKPYMVEVTEQKSDEYSFVAVQYGSEIVATPTVEDTDGKGIGVKNFEGETVSNGKDDGYLTNYGTYSGVTINAKKEVNGSIEDYNIVYYFNKNKYVSSVTLNGNKYKDVYIRPFRSYYLPSTSSPSKMIGFNIVYDQYYFDEGIATSIDKTSKPKVMTITTDKRCMLINALENVQVKIMSANGANMGSFFMNAGEQKQMSLPSGVYIVNKTKVIVK